MRLLKFLIVAFLATGLTILCNWYQPFQLKGVPALGTVFNPFSGVWQNATPEEPKASGRRFAQLEKEVEVAFDERLVPHIFAENLKDAYFIQGYLTAKNRLWQMELTVRSTAGELAEVLGPALAEHDRLQRRKGLVFAAKNTLKSWESNPEGMALIQAFSDGVNAYVAELKPKDYPLEYKLIGYRPSYWSPLKTVLVTKAMAISLCMREHDLEATNTLAMLGQETFNLLFPEYNPAQRPIVPPQANWLHETGPLAPVEGFSQIFPHTPYPKSPPHLGSNNWAVSGAKTANGYPILCNDPHLQLTLPAIWYELQLHTPETNVYGVSIPGMPGVILGFNESIAWGSTNGSQDVLDWYKVKWTDEHKTAYWIDGTEEAVELKIERIKVKGAATIVDTVRYTRWGPVVYEDPDHPQKDLAMRWAAHDQPEVPDFFFVTELNAAKNYDDYTKATSNYSSPIQNFVFASKDGDIAIRTTGKHPVKAPQQGRFIQDGSKSSSAWKDWIPFSAMPHVRNPERGYVFSANQHPTDTTYPYYYNGKFDDYRARYLGRRLEAMQQISVADMQALQLDNYSIKAEEALPLFLQYLDRSQLNTIDVGLLKLLEDWDYNFDSDARAPILFEEWWDAFYQLTWDEFTALSENAAILYPETWRTIDLLRNDPLNIYFDKKDTEQREDPGIIVTEAFKQMVKQLKPKLDEVNYDWGEYWNLDIRHLARIPAFSKMDLEPGGYSQALNAIRSTSGPSWRMVVELGPEVKGYGVYPGGQDGNPASPFYANMVDPWLQGEYFELFFMQGKEDARQPILFTDTYKTR